MRRRVILACCITIVLLTLGIVYAQINGQQGQDLEFVVAALTNQLHASGKTLEVMYQYQSTGGLVLDVKYIRTPTRVMFIEIEGISRVDKSSYNAATTEVRTYGLLKAKGRQLGSISDDLSWPLGTCMVMDPVLYFGWEGFLLDTIGRGVIADSMEDVDGHPCYRVDVTPADEAYTPYTVWVDPKIGYCPRKLVAQEEKPTVAELSDYIELGDGIWFPKKIKRMVDMPAMREKVPSLTSDTVELISEVKTVKLVETDLEKPPIVEFPSGTEVTDKRTGEKYVVP